jgi:Tfp pilus assembly protein PilF
MSQRLHALDLAIERAPDAPVNYLLRGEYWLDAGEADLAKQDLEMAIQLAKQQLESSDWGYILQSYIDRAEEQLKRLP